MVTLNEGLRNFLLGDMGIFALVVDRVYPIRLPQKVTLPAITYQLVSDTRDGHLHGVAGTSRARFQVDTYALKPADANALQGLARQRLDGFKGEFSDNASPESTVVIQRVAFDTAIELFDEDILGGSSRNSADYFVFHSTMSGVM